MDPGTHSSTGNVLKEDQTVSLASPRLCGVVSNPNDGSVTGSLLFSPSPHLLHPEATLVFLLPCSCQGLACTLSLSPSPSLSLQGHCTSAWNSTLPITQGDYSALSIFLLRTESPKFSSLLTLPSKPYHSPVHRYTYL